MAQPYATYFENFFEALRMARPDYKAQAEYALRAGRQAQLAAVFNPLLADLEAAINGFDENLTDRQQPTQGNTEAYKTARKAWLAFVDDTMKDYITPKLRKLPVYADFKVFGKSKLAALKQDALLVDSQKLIKLYALHAAALAYPAVAADATARLAAVAALDETRDTADAATGTTILALADDRAAIARAERRFKAQLELTFDAPAKVYSFFDFSRAKLPKAKKTTDGTTPA